MKRDTNISKGNFISKEESVMLQAIAVMLMVFHHLFGFPERIQVPYALVLDFEFLHIETILSYWGRICISIFAFCSGYGLYKVGKEKLLDGYKIVIKRLQKFYSRYWMICLVFVPIGYALRVYKFNSLTLIKSLLGLSSSYNKEWWYVGTYLGLLLWYPVVFCLMTWIHKKTGKYSILISGIIWVVISIAYGLLEEKGFWCWFLCFTMGMYAVQHNIFEMVYDNLQKMKAFKYILTIICFAGIYVVRSILVGTCNYDYIFTPIVIFCILVILKCKICLRFTKKILSVVGKYSTYIWLIHTFFAYYYFQKFTFWVKYSWLILIWCLLCCVMIGVVLEYIVQWIERKTFIRK